MVPKLTSLRTPSKEEFLCKIFESREITHLMHLKSKSFSEHIALGEYYDKILDLMDGLIESVQGKYGILNIKCDDCEVKEPISYFIELAGYLETNSERIFSEGWIRNQIDTIIELVYLTLYKLKNLK